ncbi:MAG: hypothetical protein HZB38_09770, partial [Planctomycetes bacterium]|nr:hypothetical protein [Planctomycetota bacterium]
MLSIEWHGESFVLDGRGAISWPARRTVILTDPHIGKDAHFRRSAIPVPFGSTLADLERIRALLSDHGADHLLILGDFFHAAEGAR